MTSFKRLSVILSLVILGGCVSTGYYETVDRLSNVTPNIVYAPAIDVSYADVLNASDRGVTVRWGGEVVGVSKLDETLTRLTLEVLPLNGSGRPTKIVNTEDPHYFVVDLGEEFSQTVNLKGHLVTLYGVTEGLQVVSINNLKESVPSIKLREIVDWDIADREFFADRQRENGTYYSNVRYSKYSRRSIASGFRHGSGFGHSFEHSSLGLGSNDGHGFNGGDFCRY